MSKVLPAHVDHKVFVWVQHVIGVRVHLPACSAAAARPGVATAHRSAGFSGSRGGAAGDGE